MVEAWKRHATLKSVVDPQAVLHKTPGLQILLDALHYRL
jgi:hypothetical protein